MFCPIYFYRLFCGVKCYGVNGVRLSDAESAGYFNDFLKQYTQ